MPIGSAILNNVTAKNGFQDFLISFKRKLTRALKGQRFTIISIDNKEKIIIYKGIYDFRASASGIIRSKEFTPMLANFLRTKNVVEMNDENIPLSIKYKDDCSYFILFAKDLDKF